MHKLIFLIVALSLTSVTGCATLANLIHASQPIACAALVAAIDPQTGQEIARGLCPAVATALEGLLKTESTPGARKAAVLPRRVAIPECGDLVVSAFHQGAPASAVLCSARLGGEQEARRLYALAAQEAQEEAQSAKRKGE